MTPSLSLQAWYTGVQGRTGRALNVYLRHERGEIGKYYYYRTSTLSVSKLYLHRDRWEFVGLPNTHRPYVAHIGKSVGWNKSCEDSLKVDWK